jgi:Uma2 family endonuclease
MTTKNLLTIDDFVCLPESDGDRDLRYELVEGELITVSPGMFRHNVVRDTLLIILRTFVASKNLGTVVSEQAFHLVGNTVMVPDLAFLRTGRQLPDYDLPKGAPDLAVEVISPTNTLREMDRKISHYFAAGCRRVWLMYPEHNEIYIHGLSGVTRLKAEEQLEDAELLPGFSVKVATLFEA